MGENRRSKTAAPCIVGIGELLWDILPGGARLGGAPANFTVFCARLGNLAILASGIGDDDYGRSARKLLVQPGLDLQQLQTSRDHPTGTVEVVFSADNLPRYTISPHVAWDYIDLTSGLLAAANSADAVCFGTLAQRDPCLGRRYEVSLKPQRKGACGFCDVNLRAPFFSPDVLNWSMAHATIIKLSDEELPQVFCLLNQLGPGKHPMPADPQAAAHLLLDYFPSCVLVATTMGANGSLLTTRGGACEHPGFSIQLVDTVGAGDAFTAGLLHAYLRGASLSQMAEIGNLCGSYVASRPGASPPLSSAFIDSIRAVSSLHAWNRFMYWASTRSASMIGP